MPVLATTRCGRSRRSIPHRSAGSPEPDFVDGPSTLRQLSIFHQLFAPILSSVHAILGIRAADPLMPRSPTVAWTSRRRDEPAAVKFWLTRMPRGPGFAATRRASLRTDLGVALRARHRPRSAPARSRSCGSRCALRAAGRGADRGRRLGFSPPDDRAADPAPAPARDEAAARQVAGETSGRRLARLTRSARGLERPVCVAGGAAEPDHFARQHRPGCGKSSLAKAERASVDQQGRMTTAGDARPR